MILRPCLFPILFLSLFSTSAAPKPKEGPTARLQRQLNGVWQDLDGLNLRVEIRRNATDGGTLYSMHLETVNGKKEWRIYETSPYKVVGKDRIRVLKSDTVYRIVFTKAGMDWTIPGVQGKRRWKRMHALPVVR